MERPLDLYTVVTKYRNLMVTHGKSDRMAQISSTQYQPSLLIFHGVEHKGVPL